jgi:hypothetical protein
MIDTSAYALWSADDLSFTSTACALPAFSIDDPQADSPRARRLQVLIAEARAAGTPWSTIIRIFVDWVGVALPELPRSESLNFLRGKLACADQLMRGVIPAHSELYAEPRNRRPTSARSLAVALGGGLDLLAADIKSESESSAQDSAEAWTYAVALLATIADVGGEPAIAKCAELAYRRLFLNTATATKHETRRARSPKRKAAVAA